MAWKDKKVAVSVFLFLAGTFSLAAQMQAGQDSLVRLMQAESIELIEKYGQKYRKTVKPNFLHNGTYLICDTALWNVDSRVINCEGHVQLIQGDANLTSDRLDYIIDEDLAQFRGSMVELKNKENNRLRTRTLDYNTRDSMAIFRNGASMKDADGKVFESVRGTYSSSRRVFHFYQDVNMFTDSVFVRTDSLEYDSVADRAVFISHLDFWKDGNMLSSDSGWYDNRGNTFFFTEAVHAMGGSREAWCDSLYYYRPTKNILLLSNAQVQDTSRNVAALADRIFYEDTLSRVTLTKNAAVAVITKEKEKSDTLYMGADTLVYRTVRFCDIDASEVASAKSRLDEIKFDPIAEYRRKAAEAAEEAARKAAESDANIAGALRAKGKQAEKSNEPDTPVLPDSPALSDSLALPDSLSLADSLAVPDSLALAEAPDTTRRGFVTAIRNIKAYRHDMQLCCDSLIYNDLDSIARLFINPVIWNDGNRQYSSDSIRVLIGSSGVDRANLMSNAFIITREDSICFNQIKGTDVMAYFDSTSALSRFDALGDATAMFFLEENGTFATVNNVQSKMLSATLSNGDLDRVYYFDSPKNDACPLAQMSSSDLRMKGFNWDPESRPEGREDITALEIRPSEREEYSSHPKTSFPFTDEYFPGYMKGVYREIEERKSAPVAVSEPASVSAPDTSGILKIALAGPDAESVSVTENVSSPDSVSVADSSAVAVADTIRTAVDSAAVAKVLSPREEKRLAAEARRKARWDALDARDAARAEAKEAARKARLGRKREKELLKLQRQNEKDEAKLQKYIEYYQKKKDRNVKAKPEPSGERPEGVEAGGDVQTTVES